MQADTQLSRYGWHARSRTRGHQCLYVHVQVHGLKTARLQRGQKGVAPEVNLKNPSQVGHKACKQGIHPDFETQGRCHQTSKKGVSATQQKVFKNRGTL